MENDKELEFLIEEYNGLFNAIYRMIDDWDEGGFAVEFSGQGDTKEQAIYHCKNAIMNFIGLMKTHNL